MQADIERVSYSSDHAAVCWSKGRQGLIRATQKLVTAQQVSTTFYNLKTCNAHIVKSIYYGIHHQGPTDPMNMTSLQTFTTVTGDSLKINSIHEINILDHGEAPHEKERSSNCQLQFCTSGPLHLGAF